MMRFYIVSFILDEEDIFKSILLDWLLLKDLLYLDQALNHQHRLQLHTFLQSQSFQMIQPFQGKQNRDLWIEHHKTVFQWMALRKVYHSQGQWNINCWGVLSAVPSRKNKNVNYRPILENMREMYLSGLPANFDLSQLTLCKELSTLSLYGLRAKHVSSFGQTHICPKLQSLTLEHCDVSKTVIDAFAHCHHLQHLKLEYNDYEEKDEEQDFDDETAALFARLQSLTFLGDVNDLVYKFLPKGIVLSVSKLLLEGESSTESILYLVTHCPLVRELELSGVDFNFPLALKAIRESMPELSNLVVDSCFWTEEKEESAVSVAELVNPGQQLHTLVFHSTIRAPNRDLDMVLKFCGQFVREFKLHLGENLQPTAYRSIHSYCPYLTSFTLLYFTLEPGELSQDHMNEIQRVFCSQSQIRVILINEWRDEHRVPHEAVFFDSANH